MDAFQKELMRRSPLAACVLEVCDFIFDGPLLQSVWEAHRGRCYQDVLGFEDFLRLMRDALVRHGSPASRAEHSRNSARLNSTGVRDSLR